MARPSNLPSAKPVAFPKAKAPQIKVSPILSPEQSLKQFATKPVVKAPRVSARALTRVPQNPLIPPGGGGAAPKVPAPKAGIPLVPLKSYLP